MALLLCVQAFAAEVTQWQGARLTDLLDELSAQGLQIIYSSALVDSELLLVDEPDLSDPVAGLRAALQPFGLTLVDGPADSWLVVRQEPAPGSEAVAKAARIDEVALPEIIVASSLHRLAYAHATTHTSVDRELISRTPAAAEEAVRMTARLPGTAGGGISTRNHVRGGEANEVLFLLDGLRLYEPFHLKDFQSVATIINSNAIAGIDFYSGAYPARFGDRMSGVISMRLREPEKPIETELALSFFNTSLLSMGRFGANGQGDWLVAARRGNLDLIADIINPEIGSPNYQDYIVHAGWEFGSRAVISANLLVSTDKLRLADVERGERANANYRNRVLWLNWRADWNSNLSSETIFSVSDISNDRNGTLLLPGIVSGSLDENREFRSVSLHQDWTYTPSPTWMLEFGFDAGHLDASYVFDSTKSVTPPFDELLDNELLTIRNFNLEPEGAQYGAHVQLRWQPFPKLIVDAGLRWDRQSYTTAEEDSQTSPRVGLLYFFNDNTEFRLGWGQYSQAQEINELQVSDGLDRFFPAQRAEHVVANLKYSFANRTNVEISFYRKSFRAVRPRFENAFNTLTLVPEIQFDRHEIDAASALAQGVEILLTRGNEEEALFWWISYAWSEVRDEISGATVPRAWDQTHTVKAGMSWRWGHWDFSAAGELHTGWPSREIIAETVTDPNGSERLQLSTTDPGSRRYSANHTLDVRISRDFEVPRGDITVFMEVTNVYDRSNPCCIEYSLGPGTGGVPTLLGRERHWLPLVPSLGVVWRF